MSTLQKGSELQEGQSLQEKIRNNPVATKAATLFAALSMLMASPALESCSEDSKETPDVISPTITIINNKNEIDITGGKTFSRSQNKLFMDNEEIANRKDNITTNCKVDIKYTNSNLSETKEINGNVFIINPGTITITIEDDAGNITSKKINLTSQNPEEELITGLENLYKLNIIVDEPVNLLEGVNIKNGLQPQVSIEIDGVTTHINNPYNYTFEEPCTFNMIITLEDKDYPVNNLVVKPIEYNELTIDEYRLGNEFPWYTNLSEGTKEWYYIPLHESIFASTWYKDPNKRNIMARETYDGAGENNIGGSTETNTHSNSGYNCLNAVSPHTITLGCNDNLYVLFDYIDKHPQYNYFISCSQIATYNNKEGILGNDSEQERTHEDYTFIQKISKMHNVLFCCALPDKDSKRKVYNQNENGDCYSTSSINGTTNPIFSISGYNTRNHGNNYYSSDNSGLKTKMPVGYKLENNNIVIPAHGGIDLNGQENFSTFSSLSTSIELGILSVMCEIIMTKMNKTVAEASDMIKKHYLTKEPILYKENGEMKNGGYQYHIDHTNFYKEIILGINEIKNIEFNSEHVTLPNNKGILLKGKGIFIKYKGKNYETTEENKSVIINAILSGDVEERFLDKKTFKKEGGKDVLYITICGIKDGKRLHTDNIPITIK